MILCNVDILKLRQLKYKHKFNITLGAPMGDTVITGNIGLSQLRAQREKWRQMGYGGAYSYAAGIKFSYVPKNTN
jgi:hypothetical protein